MDTRRRHWAERLLSAPARFGGQGHAASADDLPDLAEDEVWSSFLAPAHEAEDADGRHDPDHASDRPWADRQVGGLSLAFEGAYRGAAAAQRPRVRQPALAASAPVDVPAWPRSVRAGSGGPAAEREEEEEEEGEDADEWLPPHEYVARAHGRSMATSVLEGAGRTLKGRDMSRVRDAVWNQTGFFG
ncbi:hypothetical protein OPV22_024398 [Ensete ventricosum]|uniref:Senescence regulator n=1 Tax=Ensete ventricosum TaxID=4639 RepID=A0AAV8P7C6_ENSVE|nr:hypothetical protein OPV22_024398 [Ensete ventricosum]